MLQLLCTLPKYCNFFEPTITLTNKIISEHQLRALLTICQNLHFNVSKHCTKTFYLKHLQNNLVYNSAQTVKLIKIFISPKYCKEFAIYSFSLSDLGHEGQLPFQPFENNYPKVPAVSSFHSHLQNFEKLSRTRTTDLCTLFKWTPCIIQSIKNIRIAQLAYLALTIRCCPLAVQIWSP